MITLYFRPRLPALTSTTAVLASEAIVADGRKVAQSPGKAAPPKERRYVELQGGYPCRRDAASSPVRSAPARPWRRKARATHQPRLTDA